jgi:chemotaxis protein MotB
MAENTGYTAPEEEESSGSPGWIITFADMMSLLLCFFVLLLASSSIDARKFKEAADSLRKAFQFTEASVPGDRTMTTPAENDKTPTRPTPKQAMMRASIDSDEQRLLSAKREIDDYIRRSGLSKYIQTQIGDDNLQIVNSNPLNFPPGEAELLESSQQYLDALLPILDGVDFQIIVEGHTDNVPINTTQFMSNWELAAARAASFVRYLEDHGIDPTRLSVHSYGPHRPVASNETEDDRARNRRIEIKLAPQT